MGGRNSHTRTASKHSAFIITHPHLSVYAAWMCVPMSACLPVCLCASSIFQSCDYMHGREGLFSS